MDHPADPDPPDPIRYILTYRHAIDGRTAVTLTLLRRGETLMKSVIARVRREELHQLLAQCRQHLGRRGVEQVEAFGSVSTSACSKIGKVDAL